MNIKNLTGVNTLTTPVGQVGKVDRQIKSESSHDDRDANGQQLFNQKRKKEKMTEEQFEKALALLKEKKFITEMNWTVSADVENGVKYAWIKDQEQNTIRKIIEFDLWELFSDTKVESTKGQLLKKTA
jgi:hypothetical protein